MKKMILALILALVLTCAAALAESAYTYFPETEDYLGTWLNADGVLIIQHSEQDENLFRCTVIRHEADGTVLCWEYDGCAYDDITAGMACEKIGVKTRLTFEGKNMIVEPVFSDGAAVFAMDENGDMVFMDMMEAPGTPNTVFMRQPVIQVIVDGVE